MSPLFNRVRPHQPVAGQLFPVFEAIATKKSLQRLHHDGCLPYVLPTESDVPSDDISVPEPPDGGAISEDIQAIIERPLDDDELEIISHIIAKDLIISPREIYDYEVSRESERVREYMSDLRSTAFSGRNGVRRQVIIARRNIRRRWQKLGVWNPEWGFNQRKARLNDDRFHKWTWRSHSDDVNRPYDEAAELAARGLRSRRNLRRGERAIIPHSYPAQDTGADKAEAFLISRPWFTFQLEVAEEEVRHQRLPIQHRYPHLPSTQVIEWWKQRGDWWDEVNRNMFWKWRDESPSPEPEDLTALYNIRESPLEAANAMEFTPSEIDELKMIDDLNSEQSEDSCTIEEGNTPPYSPKQIYEDSAQYGVHEESIQVREQLADQFFEAPNEEFLSGLFSCKDTTLLEQDLPYKPQGNLIYPLPQNQHCLGQQQCQDRAQSPGQQSRSRSTTEASSIEFHAKPVLPQAAPAKGLGTIIVSTATPITAPPRLRKTRSTKRKSDPSHTRLKQEAGVQPKRGRGRPRKDQRQNICSTIEVKALPNGPAFAEGGVQTAPRQRGRPRRSI
ncbi:hypothetical protein O1611_g4580 [Lasiodiplodia mahajangana]|uniref:Uncharacterized protein n=1 Tax=Lasiodiplodia mahajangana TaxID=1108764 RepID=A0ACC2JNF7_9PEZI|nr:hypothetical protein O1611_g4580 [Lasiodiplodia mahajangana]